MMRIRSNFVLIIFWLFLTLILAAPAISVAEMEDVDNSVTGTLQPEMLPPCQEADPEPEPSQLSLAPEGIQPAGSMASVTVMNNADSGPGSLRQAVVDIAAGGTITFDSIMQGQTITLTSGSLNIDTSMTIDAGGVPNVTISGNNQYRVFNVTNGSFFLRNLTIINGMAPPSEAGGGILTSSPASVSVDNCTFTGNTSAAFGGGICSAGSLTVSNSTFSNNLGATYGGGITAKGPLTALNCTFTGNTSAYGSGVHAENTSNLLSCTFAANVNGSAVLNLSGNMTLYNCIVWNNPIPGVIGTGILNVYSSDVQGYVGGDNIDQNPLLGPLGNYGGNVQTMALLPGSPCLNRCVANLPVQDARGVVRGAPADMGAFESRDFNLSVVSGSPQSTVVDTNFPAPLVVQVSSLDPVSGGQVVFTSPASGASAVITGSPATIQADGTASVTAAANNTAGSYNLTATVPGLINQLNFELTNLPISADLSVTKSHTGSIIAGENLAYTITVTNNGPSDAQNASFTDMLPAGTTFVSLSSPAGWSCTTPAVGSSGTVSGSNATFAAGSTSVFNLLVHIDGNVPDGTIITNTATVLSTTLDSNPGNNSSTDSGSVIPPGVPGVTINPSSLSITEGGAVQTFTVFLNNQPTSDVIIAANSSDTTELTVSPSTLTFTPSNWVTPQTVTVTPVYDGMLDGVQTASVQQSIAAGSAAEYLTIDLPDVSVTVNDRFSAAPVLTANAGSNRVSLSWTPVAEAASYSVYSSTTPGSFPTAPVSVSAAVNEYEAVSLTTNRTYYFMVQAVDALGYSVDSNTVSAVPYHAGGGSGGNKTSPSVTTHTAVSVSASSAVLKGNITGGNLFIKEYGFYYGSEAGSLNQRKIVGDEDFDGDFSCELNGLDPEQSYYFQAYAITNSGQTVYGKTIQFTTARNIEPAPPVSQPDEQLPPGQNFSDVSDSYWAREAILEMSAKGYISGYHDGSFKPDEKISRAEFVTILVRALHLQAGNNGRSFSDTANHWAKDSIAAAAGLNICTGYADGSFKPDAFISREEMAVMVIKAAALEQAPGETSFADNSRIAGWAKGSVLAAVNRSIMKGYPDNTFRPQANASRAEAVMVILHITK